MDCPFSFAPGGQEPVEFKYSQVLGDAGLVQGKHIHEFAHAHRPLAEESYDFDPRRVGKKFAERDEVVHLKAMEKRVRG